MNKLHNQDFRSIKDMFLISRGSLEKVIKPYMPKSDEEQSFFNLLESEDKTNFELALSMAGLKMKTDDNRTLSLASPSLFHREREHRLKGYRSAKMWDKDKEKIKFYELNTKYLARYSVRNILSKFQNQRLYIDFVSETHTTVSVNDGGYITTDNVLKLLYTHDNIVCVQLDFKDKLGHKFYSFKKDGNYPNQHILLYPRLSTPTIQSLYKNLANRLYTQLYINYIKG